jgi:hypothetical protein
MPPAMIYSWASIAGGLIAKSFLLFFGSLRKNSYVSLRYGSILPKNLMTL